MKRWWRLLALSLAFLPHVEADEPKLENLLRATLEGVADTEVVISRVTLPPNTTLPKHWHPGEEFGYVIEGSVVVWMKGEEERTLVAGDTTKIPLRKVHTAMTKEQGVTMLVFRVHEAGEPERVPVDD